MEQHIKACGECPFRRDSLPGWLGSNNLEEFAELASIEHRMPCHPTVDYENPDWVVNQQSAPQCAGRAAMWANQAKRPRDREMLIGTKDPAVFNHIGEFKEHHRRFDV